MNYLTSDSKEGAAELQRFLPIVQTKPADRQEHEVEFMFAWMRQPIPFVQMLDDQRLKTLCQGLLYMSVMQGQKKSPSLIW